ncbi:MAG: hypothetical protein EOO65_04985 [Methanosarcinales archaeon]|nr:MAG: hypothetical protein EOO65_04985 [Methanosarcinales archaeon]
MHAQYPHLCIQLHFFTDEEDLYYFEVRPPEEVGGGAAARGTSMDATPPAVGDMLWAPRCVGNRMSDTDLHWEWCACGGEQRVVTMRGVGGSTAREPDDGEKVVLMSVDEAASVGLTLYDARNETVSTPLFLHSSWEVIAQPMPWGETSLTAEDRGRVVAAAKVRGWEWLCAFPSHMDTMELLVIMYPFLDLAEYWRAVDASVEERRSRWLAGTVEHKWDPSSREFVDLVY